MTEVEIDEVRRRAPVHLVFCIVPNVCVGAQVLQRLCAPS